MTEAPPALTELTVKFEDRPDRPKSYKLGGIVGNAAHMEPPEGYHVSARDERFNWGAYSLSTVRDRAGGLKYKDFASAWDLSMDESDMILVTNRLIAAAKAKDPRLKCVAEFAGTTNGRTVHAFYVNTGIDDPNNTGKWAITHIHHVHVSISRDNCDDYAALLPLLDVICGVPLEKEFTVDAAAEKRFDKIDAELAAIRGQATVYEYNTDGKHPEAANQINAKLDKVLAALAAK